VISGTSTSSGKKSSKTGTRKNSRATVTIIEKPKIKTGYVMADFTLSAIALSLLICSEILSSAFWSSPLTSPESTIPINRGGNILGCCRRAFVKEEPPSTSTAILRTMSANTGLSICPDRVNSALVKGMPEPIMTAVCLVNMIKSSFFIFLPLCDFFCFFMPPICLSILDTTKPFFLSLLWTSSSVRADKAPVIRTPLLLYALYLNLSMHDHLHMIAPASPVLAVGRLRGVIEPLLLHLCFSIFFSVSCVA